MWTSLTAGYLLTASKQIYESLQTAVRTVSMTSATVKTMITRYLYSLPPHPMMSNPVLTKSSMTTESNPSTRIISTP